MTTNQSPEPVERMCEECGGTGLLWEPEEEEGLPNQSPSLLSNPAQDQALSQEEREYARDILHSYAEIVRQGERVFSEFCQDRGVPEPACIKAMIQIATHRSATNSAHLLAMLQANDEAVSTEGEALAKRLVEALNKQMPLSRETDERTRQ